MDEYTLQQELESLAGNAYNPDLDTNVKQAEPISATLARWQRLFGLKPDEAIDSTMDHRNNLMRARVSDAHWSLIQDEKEAEGYDREAYEYELETQKKKAALPDPLPAAEGSSVTYLVELNGHLHTAEQVQQIGDMSSIPPLVSGRSLEDDRPVWLCCIDGRAKDALLRWAAQSSTQYRWLFYVTAKPCPARNFACTILPNTTRPTPDQVLNMPLQLLPLEQSELGVFQDLFWAAFKDDLMGLMYPHGFTDAAREWGIKSTGEDLRKHPDRIKLMKVVDTDLPEDAPFGKIVGMSGWEFYTHDRTEEELDAERGEKQASGLPPDTNGPLMEAFFGSCGKCKREILGGKAYVLLHVLATLPEHHRRGIGAMHLRWGLEQADKQNLPSYLEASPKGKPLYERMAYEEVRVLPFKAKEWGSRTDLVHTCMLRPARGNIEKEP